MAQPNYLPPSVQLLPEGKENGSSSDQHTLCMATLMGTTPEPHRPSPWARETFLKVYFQATLLLQPGPQATSPPWDKWLLPQLDYSNPKIGTEELTGRKSWDLIEINAISVMLTEIGG